MVEVTLKKQEIKHWTTLEAPTVKSTYTFYSVLSKEKKRREYLKWCDSGFCDSFMNRDAVFSNVITVITYF